MNDTVSAPEQTPQNKIYSSKMIYPPRKRRQHYLVNKYDISTNLLKKMKYKINISI